MSALPAGWAECEIGEVAEVVAGGTPPARDKSNFANDGGIPWLTPADLSGYRSSKISRGARNLSDKGFGACSAVKMPAGAVLFSSRAPVGYVCVAENEISTNQGFKSFVLPAGFESQWVYYWLRYIKPIAEQMATGTTFKELSGSAAKKLPLRVSPLAEQKRISDKLDALLARVDSVRARLERVPALLKRFRQSVLAAANSGQLTEDWRGGGNDMWGSYELSQLCEKDRVVTYGVVKLGDEVGDGVPCLRTSNVRWLKIDVGGVKRISEEISDSYSRTILRGNEVLVNVRGTLGGVAPSDCSMVGWNISREVAAIPVDLQKVDKAFLAIYIATEKSQRWLTSALKGVAYTGINIEDLRTLPVGLPPLEEQHEIVRRVEALFTLADKAQAQYDAARARIDRLTAAILAKAFRGELVPQDPNDEPASVLLERIRAERAAAPRPARRTRKRADERSTEKI